MATEKTEQWTDTDPNTSSDGWAEVEAESQIVLEAEGEGFTALWMGQDPPNVNGIIQGHFDNVHYLTGELAGASCFMNLTRDLIGKLAKVPSKRQVRIQWTHSMDTGQISPMRVFRVQWR